jgi:hypothetical protein
LKSINDAVILEVIMDALQQVQQFNLIAAFGNTAGILYFTAVTPAQGTIKRLPFFGYCLLYAVGTGFLGGVVGALYSSRVMDPWMETIVLITGTAISFVLGCWLGKLSARRARDAGWNPRNGAIVVIPLAVLILFFWPTNSTRRISTETG